MLDHLLTHLCKTAPDSARVPILQPADPFLETAGEDLRRRIFITQTNAGDVQCLRPEFTIPICLAHLESGKSTGRYAYGGTVFRQERRGASEFQQVGLEDIGNGDTVAADAACMADMVATLAEAGVNNPSLILGDQSLFAVVVQSLNLPEAIAQRLVRNFGSPKTISALIDSLTVNGSVALETSVIHELARAGDESALTAHVAEMLNQANIAPTAGRSPRDIARRMIRKVGAGSFQLDAAHAAMLRAFLDIEVTLADAPKTLANFSNDAGIDFGTAGKNFIARIDALSSLGLSPQTMTYRASFGRNLEYYTGVLFEAVVGDIAVAGGGRYDRLCSLLGAEAPVPAVGFSMALDRVEEVL